MQNAQVIIPDHGDRKHTLRAALRARQYLMERFNGGAHATALRGVHRLDGDRAYFELEVPSLEQAIHSLDDLRIDGHAIAGIVVETADPSKGEPCLNCGNIAGSHTPPVCPSCGFQEISACPYCEHLSSRTSYTSTEGALMRCPHCGRRVRLRYNEPIITRDGNYRSPVVLVERAEQGLK
jgi:hypothetical protein